MIMTGSGNITIDNDSSEINFSNNLNFYDRIKTRKGNSKRNRSTESSEENHGQWRLDSEGKKQKNNGGRARRGRGKAAKKPNSPRSSYNNSISSLGGTGLSCSIDGTRSLTPLMNGNFTSEYISLESGKDKGGIVSPSTNETTQRNPSNTQEISRNFRLRSKYVWFSDSLKKSFGIEDKIPTNDSKTSSLNKRRGVTHSIVGKGADETEADTTTETLGHDNGNPQDLHTEIISNVLYAKHSELQAEEKASFESKKLEKPSYVKNNTKETDGMTMDTDTRMSATNILLETNNNSTAENKSKSTSKKDRSQLKTNSRLRSRSSSDDTALLSRQNSIRSSAIVTQHQAYDKTALVGTLEINPTKSGLNLKDTYTKETLHNSEKEKEKSKRANSGLLGKVR